MKIYDEDLYCVECDTTISIQEALFNGNLCDECAFSTDPRRAQKPTGADLVVQRVKSQPTTPRQSEDW